MQRFSAITLVIAVLTIAFISPGYAADYVLIGTYEDSLQTQVVRQRLEREGYPVEERLVNLSEGRTALQVLVGPYRRTDRARYQLNKLHENGWNGTLRRFEEVKPKIKPEPLISLEPPTPVERVSLERPPQMLESIPKVKPSTAVAQNIVKEIEVKPVTSSVVVDETPVPTPVEEPMLAIVTPELKQTEQQAIEQTVIQEAVAALELEEPEGPTWRSSGFVALEGRAFSEDALYPGQKNSTASLVVQPELYLEWNDGDSSVTLTPFVRIGDQDDERNHGDIRELIWLTAFQDWEVRLGIGRTFWGVTESLHLVDVINQVDLVESPDEEDKLGQAMVNITRISDWGTFDLFVLPGFRERTFAGVEGRLRAPLVVETGLATYESSDGDDHLDWALRWTHFIGDIDIGLSYFSGTSRDPLLVQGINATGQPVLIPHYDLIDQAGLSLQAILGDWLWKLEMTATEQRDANYTAMVGGFEYTYVGLFDSNVDLGMLMEYLYDDRGQAATTPFEDDLMLGLRWVFNDVQSSEILMGAVFDMDGDATSITVEASRRLGDSWKLGVEYRGITNVDPKDPLYWLRADDYLQLEFARYF